MLQTFIVLTSVAFILVINDLYRPLGSRRRARIVRSGGRCTAEVVRINEWDEGPNEGWSRRPRYQPVVRFVDLGGEMHLVGGEIGRRWAHDRRELRVQDAVQIAYDSDCPGDLVYLSVRPPCGFGALADWTLFIVVIAMAFPLAVIFNALTGITAH